VQPSQSESKIIWHTNQNVEKAEFFVKYGINAAIKAAMVRR
jgi:hypothetical protein